MDLADDSQKSSSSESVRHRPSDSQQPVASTSRSPEAAPLVEIGPADDAAINAPSSNDLFAGGLDQQSTGSWDDASSDEAEAGPSSRPIGMSPLQPTDREHSESPTRFTNFKRFDKSRATEDVDDVDEDDVEATDNAEERVCRICRCGPEVDQPLYYPCKCTGSIRYCHQDW